MFNKYVTFYTDGACSGNPGTGGWSFCHYDENEEKGRVFYGFMKNATNNQMEMSAVIMALHYAHTTYEAKECNVVIVTDSAYIVNCFENNWMENWKRNGWMNAKKQPVKNKELWAEMDSLINKFNSVTFEKVKGHANNKLNNIVDKYAVKARTEEIVGSEIFEY